MFNSSKSKDASRIAVTTLISENTTIRGDVSFTGGLHVDGKVLGSITAEGGSPALLTLSEKGQIEGQVCAPHVIVNGHVKGDITATERVELAGQARVEGNVYYKVLEIAAGAQVNGKMVHEQEPRKQLAAPEAVRAAT